MLEAQTAGFGASGRNGGWCSALFPASLESLAARSSRTDALALHAAMRHSVDEVMQSATAEGIDAHMTKGGTISLARSRPQWARAQAEVRDARQWGRGEDELRLLDGAEATAVLAGTHVRGATYTPTVPPSIPADSSAAWPTPSYAGGSRSTSRRPPRRSHPGG